MASSISGLTNTSNSTSGSTSSATKSTMDKDAFLKLLVAQISNQDPMKPMEGTEYVSQLSQFASVEQSIAQTSKLDTISRQLSGLSSNEATSLVGKEVKVRSGDLAFDGVTATAASVTLEQPAASCTATIKDSSGKVIRTIELGAHGAGALGVTWDGKDDSGNPVARGAYKLDVKATGADGTSVDVTSEVKGVVNSVSFEKGYPEVHLESGVNAPVSDLISVGLPSSTTTSK